MKNLFKVSLLISLIFFNIQAWAEGLSPLSPELFQALEDNLFKDPNSKDYYAPLTIGQKKRAFDLIQSYKGRGLKSPHPKVVLTAGAMTAGKNSVINKMIDLKQLSPDEFLILDPDDAKKLLVSSDPVGNKKTPSEHHLLSMYITDMIRQWAQRDSVSYIYITSLRHTPSAVNLLDALKKDHPQFQTSILYVRSPITSMAKRNELRFQAQGRHVPQELLMKSAFEVDETIKKLGLKTTQLMIVSNDEDREPVLTFVNNGIELAVGRPLSDPITTMILKNIFNGQRLVKDSDLSSLFLILDWDWTLSYTVPAPLYSEEDIQFRGEHFRPVDGIREFLWVLLTHPQIRTSLFSGGDRDRNETVLQALNFIDGTNAFERFFRILSKNDLENILFPLGNKFSDERKKALANLGADIPKEQILLADDVINFSLPGEEAHMIWLQNTFNLYPTFPPKPEWQVDERKWDPETKESWALERNKLAWLLGVILTVIDTMNEKKLSPVKALAEVIRDKEGKLIDRETKAAAPFYERGIAAMNAVNPSWMKVPYCRDLLREIGSGT